MDASALVDILLQLPGLEAVEDRLFSSHESLHAPHILDVEIAQVLRRHVARGDIPQARAREALDDLAALPMQRYPHADLIPRIWDLRDNLTAYDAAYVALAEMFDAPLLTRDRRLAHAAGHAARIELI